MSYALIRAVERAVLPRREKDVLRQMVSFAKDDGTAIFPSVRRLAEMSGYSERSVRLARQMLCACRILTKVAASGPYRSARYQFHLEALLVTDAAAAPRSAFAHPHPAKH